MVEPKDIPDSNVPSDIKAVIGSKTWVANSDGSDDGHVYDPVGALTATNSKCWEAMKLSDAMNRLKRAVVLMYTGGKKEMSRIVSA